MKTKKKEDLETRIKNLKNLVKGVEKIEITIKTNNLK